MYIGTEAVAQTACLCFKQHFGPLTRNSYQPYSRQLLFYCMVFICAVDTRVFYVLNDTSLTNFFGYKKVVLTSNLCNFTFRLALGIYEKNIFRQNSNKFFFYILVFFAYTLARKPSHQLRVCVFKEQLE